MKVGHVLQLYWCIRGFTCLIPSVIVWAQENAMLTNGVFPREHDLGLCSLGPCISIKEFELRV